MQETATDYKLNTVDQWTADPCGSASVDGPPGSEGYLRELLRKRDEDAPWISDVLDYAGTRGLRVLDLGCGQGIDVARYAQAGADVTGIDLTPRHVELARKHLAALGLLASVDQGDVEQLPYAEASFERVSSNGVLHHTPDMPAALQEAIRVLAPGGEARVIVYNRNSLHYWMNQFLWSGVLQRGLLRERSMAGILSTGVEESSVGARPLVRVYSPRQVRQMLVDAGFVDVSSIVRHFHPKDAFLWERVSRRVTRLRDRQLLDRVGRVAGWYVIGRGHRPDSVAP